MSEINEWYMNIQNIVDDIDRCIKSGEDERLTLGRLSKTLGYSEYYVSRKFSEISGMKLRDYMRYRRLAFALRELRDTTRAYLILHLTTALHLTRRSQGHSKRHTELLRALTAYSLYR